ncbi:MAG: hypothetical protein ACKOFJ_07470 [Actinomycetota bacterium]
MSPALIVGSILREVIVRAIARRMGYSESLIRQETIVIYRKLGVDGRRELVHKHLFDESANN